MNEEQVKTINLEYFASIASKTGKSKEVYLTRAKTMFELWQELQTKYQFELNNKSLRAAKNHRFCDWNTDITNQDTIVFIPPVSGG